MWEYRTAFLPFGYRSDNHHIEQQIMDDNLLNEYGMKGWELVNVVTIRHFVGNWETTWGLHYIFKRRK